MLIFATQNPNKTKEIRKILPHWEIKSLDDLNDKDNVEETGNTFRENAFLKAKYFFNKYQHPVISEDSGLCVPSLNMEPGIYSARYSGEKNDKKNIEKLIRKLNGQSADAFFMTVICLIQNVEPHYFEGKIHGKIITEARGEKGFGYDPIFVPHGYEKTFAQIGAEEKNKISHRALALEKLIEFLS